jgi:ureidoacrylate peracid hydrolase
MSEIPFRYDPAHTALIVVDVQNDFCSPVGLMARKGFNISAVVEMLPNLQKLIDSSRAVGLPVIFIKTVHDETTDSQQWRDRVSDRPGTKEYEPNCRPASWGSEFYEVVPGPEDKVVIKYRYSAFTGTNLNVVLRTLGVQSLIFAGLATEICVESSLRDGLFNEYYVSLIEDCSASYSSAAHRASIDVISKNFGPVVQAEDLITHWQPRLTAIA